MEAAAEGAYEDFINEAHKLQSEEAVQRYLQTYGDTIESRVQGCLEQADRLGGGLFEWCRELTLIAPDGYLVSKT
jgi:hypothetical protein